MAKLPLDGKAYCATAKATAADGGLYNCERSAVLC
jgi:hypothetical protein